MIILFWDASSFVKRYVPETGTETVNALFSLVPSRQMALTFLGYAELHAVLVRRRNTDTITEAAYIAAASSVQDDTIDDPDFVILDMESSSILSGIELIRKHNINSSDGCILASFIRYAALELDRGDKYVLVASDRRLLRAAAAEGLVTLNPEEVAPDAVPALIASL